MRIGAVVTAVGTSAPKARMEMSDATVKLMDITSDMSSALRAGADDGQVMQRNGKRNERMNDLIKRRFGRLTVIKQCGVYVSPCGSKRKKWLCKCDCGNEVIVTTNRPTSGNTKSCGCYKSEVEKEVHTKHGGAKHEACERLYNVWKAMKRRCLNPSHKDYKYYGGTGITICDEWLNDYNAFREWAYSNGYDEKAEPMKCTLDRIDPWGKYEPTNCRWVDMYVQNEDSHKRRFLCT